MKSTSLPGSFQCQLQVCHHHGKKLAQSSWAQRLVKKLDVQEGKQGVLIAGLQVPESSFTGQNESSEGTIVFVIQITEDIV